MLMKGGAESWKLANLDLFIQCAGPTNGVLTRAYQNLSQENRGTHINQ